MNQVTTDATPPVTEPFCALLSATAGEPLLATAVAGVTNWIVLEYTGAWGSKAIAESALPPRVRARLLALEEELPGTRVQLIKRDDRPPDALMQLFVANSSPGRVGLYRFDLPEYSDLLGIDFAALAVGNGRYRERRIQQPLFLVCTNGRRDRCCAKWGLPVYAAGHQAAPGLCWQTTHIGGHRFAATLVALPHGIVFGRVQPEEIGALMDAYQAERIYRLDRYRGRTCYSADVQAAEGLLREALDEASLDRPVLVSVASAAGTTTTVWRVAGQSYRVVVAAEEPTVVTPASCGEEKPGASVVYRLVALTPEA